MEINTYTKKRSFEFNDITEEQMCILYQIFNLNDEAIRERLDDDIVLDDIGDLDKAVKIAANLRDMISEIYKNG